MKDNKKERKQFVDIAKGICILLIVRGHLNYDFFPSWLNENEFYTIWYVSAFMLIAGFFCKENDLYNPIVTLKKKGKALYLKSLYFFIPATLLHNFFINNGLLSPNIPLYISIKDWVIAFGKVFAGLSFEKMVEPLWFALALFEGFVCLSLILWTLKRFHLNTFKVETICLVTLMCLSCYINNYTDIHLPPRYGGAITSMFLIYLGKKIFKEYAQTFASRFFALLSFIILLMYTFTIGSINKGHLIGMIINQYPDIVTLIIGSLAGMYLTLFIGKRLEGSLIGNIIAKCGKESFYIIALHMFFYRVLILYFNDYIGAFIDGEGSIFPNSLGGFSFLFLASVILVLIFVYCVRLIIYYVRFRQVKF